MDSGSVAEKEVASYVLAYLLQHQYKNTANAFLRECQQLPSKSLIVLPEVPLSSIIAQHKAQKNAKVLVSTLGRERAWQELWGKLHTTLSQIRCVSEEFNSHRFQQQGKVKAARMTGDIGPKSSGRAAPAPSTVLTSSFSPHKRKQGPRRKILQASTTPAPLEGGAIGQSMTSSDSSSRVATPPRPVAGQSASGTSPTMQQVLDTVLEDEGFPGKLADIINQCVISDNEGHTELSAGISTDILEQILTATLSEPSLESVLPSAPPVSCVMATTVMATTAMATTSQVSVDQPSSGTAISGHRQSTPSAVEYGSVPTVSVGTSYRDLVCGEMMDEGDPVLLPRNCADVTSSSTHVTFSSALSPAVEGFQDVLTLAKKRPRIETTELPNSAMDFPSEQDIDSFLDEIHH